jgi:uncharacterized protein YfaS (alpha-2-macroglobulin family)
MWPGGTADDFASTYALQLLLEAKDRQLAVPPDMVSKATVYLQSRLGSGDTSSAFSWRNRADGLPAHPPGRAGARRAGQPAAGPAGRPAARQGQPLATDLGAAYLAAAFALQKQDATAQALMAPVWSDLQQRVARKQPLNRWDYYYDPLVHDSTLILLGARHFPKLLASLPVESWSRLAAMIGEGWYSTQSSATTILAVDAYARAAAASAGGSVTAQAVDKAGKSLALPLTGELRSLQQAAVPNGTAKLKLSNPGNLPLYYGWAETGYERNLPDTAVTHGLEITQAILDEKATPSAKPASARK